MLPGKISTESKTDEGLKSGPLFLSVPHTAARQINLRIARRSTAYIPEGYVGVYTTPFCGQRSVGRATLAAGATSRERPGQHLPSLLRSGASACVVNEHALQSEG